MLTIIFRDLDALIGLCVTFTDFTIYNITIYFIVYKIYLGFAEEDMCTAQFFCSAICNRHQVRSLQFIFYVKNSRT